jgi:hypothetical protein
MDQQAFDFTATSQITEEWKDIPGFPGYQVCNLGKVRSYKPRGPYCPVRTEPLTLVSSPNSKGYLVNNLCGPAIKKCFHLHVLVMQAFGPPKPPGTEISHVDGDKNNCAITNLEWETHQKNMDRCFDHGTAPVGELNPRAKITEADVPMIRQLRFSGSTFRSIAESYNVTIATIFGVTSRKTWKHVP